MKRVLEVVPDEKFIDAAIALYGMVDYEIEHKYVFISDKMSYSFKYIKNSDQIRVVSPQKFIEILNSEEYHAVVIHCIFSCPILLIPQIPRSISVFWIAWGCDIYQLPCVRPAINVSLYRTRTKKLFFNSNRIRQLIYKFRVFIAILRDRSEEYRQYKNAVSRVDYFSGILPEEYNEMRKNSYFKAKPFRFKYGLPVSCASLTAGKYTGRNILVGNSGAPTNNHLDMFEKIKQYSFKDRKIIVPLNYGGDEKYLDAVLYDGKSKLGKCFAPLMSFIEYKDYEALVSTCSVGIFFHERQQAIGNITMMLLMGCKVFLSETSITYKHYKNRGVVVFSIQKDLNQRNLDTELTNEEIENNRAVIINDLTYKAFKDRLYDMYNKI